MDTNANILVLAFNDELYQSNKRLIITGEWEHIAIPAEARDFITSRVRDALASITDGEGKIDMRLAANTNETSSKVYNLAESLHIASSIMEQLKIEFQQLPDDVRGMLLDRVSSK